MTSHGKWAGQRAHLVLVPKSPIRAVKQDIVNTQLELQLAQERLVQRRAMISKLVIDIRHDATVGAVLLKAMTERDREEQERDALADKLARMEPDEGS